MPKLSKEAWTVAFYEVMKEPLPPSKGSLGRVGEQLAQQKVKAEQKLKDAKRKTERATAIADDAENKRYGAGVQRDEVFSKTLTEEGRKSAQQDYDAAEQRARETAAIAKQARLAEKEAKFALEQLDSQIADIQKRTQSGNVEGLSDDLKTALQQAQLEKKLEFETTVLEDIEEKLRLREEELASAKRKLAAGEAFILEGDVAGLKERVERSKAKQAAITALLPGFELKPAEPAHVDVLAETVKSMKGAAAVAGEAAAAQQAAVGEKQAAAGEKQKLLDSVAAKDPKLAEAHKKLEDKRAALAAAQEKLADNKRVLDGSEQNFQNCQKVLDAYASGSDPQPGPRDLDSAMLVVDVRVKTLARDRTDLRESQDAVRKAASEVETARTELDAAMKARAKEQPQNADLIKALAALQSATDEVERAQAALAQSKQEAERIQGIATEAQRRLTVAQALPKAVEAAGEVNAALKGYEDVPIWEGSSELRGKMGAKKYDSLVALANKLQAQYETLTKNGATMEELQAVYKNTPELWQPPRFREEEQNWVSMKDLVDDEAQDKFRKETETRLSAVDKKIEKFKKLLKPGETVASMLAKGTEGAESLKDHLPEGALEALADALGKHKELAGLAENVLGLAGKIVEVVQAPIKAIDSAQKSMQTEDPIEALMLQDEFMESLGKLVEGLTGGAEDSYKALVGTALVSQMASLLPGIGVGTGALAAMKGFAESASRIDEALQDADSHAEAEATGHRAKGAIGQFAKRDKHLAARAVSKTGVAMIKTAASAVDLTGVGATAGAALKGVATGVSAVQSVAEVVIDRSEGETAQKLLDRAQAGDGHARAELFSCHPRYAKGILAVLAAEGDPMALQVLGTHGLTEDMIKRSSPKIIKRYLMKKFGETDDVPSWSSAIKSAQSTLDGVATKLQAAEAFFGNIADTLLAKFDSNDLVAGQAELNKLAYQLPAQEVSTAVTSLAEVRRRRETLAADASPEHTADLQALDLALAKEVKDVEKVRNHVLTSLGNVRGVIEKIGKQPKSPLRDKAEGAAKVVLREHLARVEELAKAA